MRKRSLAFGLAALALFGTGLATGRLIWGEGPGRRTPSLAPSVRVPDVTGLELAAAVDALRRVGLSVDGRALRARPDASTRGTVLSQGVSAGSPTDVGSSVPLVLSAGLHPQLITGHRVVVGGTCELTAPPGTPPCVGGELLAPLAPG